MDNAEKKTEQKEQAEEDIKRVVIDLTAEKRKSLRGPDNVFYEHRDGLD